MRTQSLLPTTKEGIVNTGSDLQYSQFRFLPGSYQQETLDQGQAKPTVLSSKDHGD